MKARLDTPFLSWAGGKQKFIQSLLDHHPGTRGRYFEPFLGGGSLFFRLRPRDANLSDINADLVSTYAAVRDDVEGVIRRLRAYKYSRDNYYRVRDRYKPRIPAARAARFIYLNKTCWNGLYRENLNGHFNVPFGQRKNPNFLNEAELRACSAALQGVALDAVDFETASSQVRSGDFVYFDPPYVTSHNNNGFVHYNARLFTWHDQVRLAAVAKMLCRRGATVWVTNAAHQPLLDLYGGFDIVQITRVSTIAAKTSARRPCREVLLIGRSDSAGHRREKRRT